MLDQSLATRYAQALFSVVRSHGGTAHVTNDLVALLDCIESTPSFRSVIYHPAISVGEKKAAAREIVGKSVSDLAMRFLEVLLETKRIHYLRLIADTYASLVRRSENRVSIRVITSRPLAGDAQLRLSRLLEQRLGRQVELQTEIDADMIGGVTLVFDDNNVIDGSAALELERLKEAIVAG